MLRVFQIEEFLSESGVKAHISRARPTDMPIRQVVITRVPGPRATREGAIERVTFRVECRGQSHDDAEELAEAVDLVLFPRGGVEPGEYETVYPVDIEARGHSTHVLAGGRAGGAPAVSAVDPQGRFVVYAATYWLGTER